MLHCCCCDAAILRYCLTAVRALPPLLSLLRYSSTRYRTGRRHLESTSSQRRRVTWYRAVPVVTRCDSDPHLPVGEAEYGRRGSDGGVLGTGRSSDVRERRREREESWDSGNHSKREGTAAPELRRRLSRTFLKLTPDTRPVY
eukprot:COSAG02_NODE_911_length_16005_cov_9.262983_8_plen_143_part_00